uniref:Cysteine-serine-rich nuclear protein 1a n=1 Tax=Sphaeramia orbicularis TaxID=375764 RepID=A0A673B671_9TELE
MRGILKRKFTEVEDSPCSSSSSDPSSLSSSSDWESDGEISSCESPGFTPHSPSAPTSSPVRSILKRPRLAGVQSNVRFDLVTVFSFQRCQGFTSVPSRGGATLGMVRRHSALQRFTVAEHALEQRQRRKERLRDRLREERLQALKQKLISSGAIDHRAADRLTVDQVPDQDSHIHISDAELEDGGFLQPYSSKQRQALLQAAGVKRIDKEEKRQLHALRLSREACGCDCQGFCEPESCACSLAGIKCQMDRFNFPCGCTKDGCGNTQGRIEFDSRRVRTHYIHTIMRLDLERRLRDESQSEEDRSDLSEDLQQYEDEAFSPRNVQDENCPFRFPLEEDELPLSMPTTAASSSSSFHFIPERRESAMEENSCSSDMTDSSCSSSDSGGCISGNLPEVDGGLSHVLSISENNTYSLRHMKEPLMHNSNSTTTDYIGPMSDSDNMSSDYLDENANQATDFLDESTLEGFPNTPSPPWTTPQAGTWT